MLRTEKRYSLFSQKPQLHSQEQALHCIMIISELLYAGAFGHVYKAMLRMIPDSGDDSSHREEEIPVAVKTIKSRFTDKVLY